MFKKLPILFTILLLGIMFSTYASANEYEKLTVVSLGDSITFGYNLEQPQNPPKQSQNAFPFLIGTGGIEVLNVSFPGWTSTHLVQVLNTSEAGTKLQQADVITLYIGANDLMQAVGLGEILVSKQPIVPTEEMMNKVNTAATQLSVNLQESIKLIRTKTDAPIMLYSIYNPFGQTTDPFAASLYNIGELITTKVNTEVISQIAAHTGSIYLDAYTAFTGNQINYIIQGDIHPTKAGHEALALLATKELPSIQPPKEMTIDEPILSTKEETSRPVLVTLPKNTDIVEFKWLPGAKNIADFATAGTKVTGNSFEIAENGIYSIYAKTAKGSEAVRSFEIKID